MFTQLARFVHKFVLYWEGNVKNNKKKQGLSACGFDTERDRLNFQLSWKSEDTKKIALGSDLAKIQLEEFIIWAAIFNSEDKFW